MIDQSYSVTLLCIVSFFVHLSDCKIPFFFKIEYCNTPRCVTIGRHISRYLNETIDPCENFYKYSCDGWTSKTKKPTSEPIWSNWQIIASKINDRIEDIINFKGENENIGLSKAAKFYYACLDNGAKEYNYVNNLRSLVKNIRGWPMVQEKITWKGYNWFRDILKLTRLLGVHPIFKVHIEPGDLIYPSYILKEPIKYPIEIKSYKFWIYQTIKYLYKNKNLRNIKLDVAKIIQFETKLAHMKERSASKRFTLSELEIKFPFNWMRAFQILNLNEDMKFSHNDTVIIKNLSYFENIFNFLQKLDPAIVANYLMWYAVKDLSRETGPQMQMLSFMVDKSVLGIRADISRRTECLNEVNKYFHNALVPLYVDSYLIPNTLPVIREIITNIKNEYIKMLKRSLWLNEQTKNLAIEKIKHLKQYIGYPIWTKNLTKINYHYEKVNISSNHFYNVVNLKNFLAETNFELYKKSVQEVVWPSGPLEVNAYYSILQNAIFIPLGILEPPFFDLNVPDSLNYGALGSLIGHEISHALDMAGRQANKYGNIGKWWIDDDIIKYEKRAECYEKLYNSMEVNGHLTLGENIADNVGIDISFAAFKKLKSSKVFTMIPHLETYSNEQLFFLAYSQMWCEISEKKDILFNDEHSPVQDRVRGTLNNENFHKYFHCDVLNKKYCKMW
ncbi:hypothetical protein WA026_010955 [Henosepilachna vigintioctopunctata]|uniref:Uncharacterized protein n=1 Tax=Henosepilachna vigintioctopunctata TaxID=420089 RepID=A0AAW1USG5_9CUCU